MKRLLALPALVLAVWSGSTTGTCAEPAHQPVRQLDKVPALPLSIGDEFQFRKTVVFDNVPTGSFGDQTGGGGSGSGGRRTNTAVGDELVSFEAKYRNFGAITQLDKQERKGHYFTFFWRADRPANLTVRLEYRQEKLGAFVQAREISYEGAKGDMKTDFSIIGDDYLIDGQVTAWRALIIEDGKIVALHSSYLWN